MHSFNISFQLVKCQYDVHQDERWTFFSTAGALVVVTVFRGMIHPIPSAQIPYIYIYEMDFKLDHNEYNAMTTMTTGTVI